MSNDWRCPACQGMRGQVDKGTISWQKCGECSGTGVLRSTLEDALAERELYGNGTIEGWKALLVKKQKERQAILSDIEDKEDEIGELEDDKTVIEQHEQLIAAAITYQLIRTGKIPCEGQLSFLSDIEDKEDEIGELEDDKTVIEQHEQIPCEGQLPLEV